MNYRRITALALTAITLFLQSCGLIIVNDMTDETETGYADESSADTNRTERETSEPYVKYEDDGGGIELAMEYLDSLPKRDYDGAVFFITTPSSDYIAPQDTTSAVSRLAVERNRIVEEKLNVKLITSVDTADNMLTEVKNAIAAETYYTDLMMLPIYQIGTYRAENTLLNMRSVPFFDLEQPYFYQESSDMASGGYTTYAIAGDASISPSSFSAVYMNTTLLESAGIEKEVVYEWAEDGKWTWDKLLLCTESVKKLNGGESGMNYYSVTSQNNAQRLPDLVFKSFDIDFVASERRKVPQIGFTVESAQDAMDVLAKIYNDNRSITDSTAGAAAIFSNGESAFLVEYLYVMSWLTNSKTEWGLLPIPKGEIKDDYKTLIANNELVFAIPKNHTNAEFAAMTLSALNAASYGYIHDEYVNYSMINTLRDNGSTKMLSIILDTASFDFALAFGNKYSAIADATYKLVRKCAASNDLEKYYKSAADRANNLLNEEFGLKY